MPDPNRSAYRFAKWAVRLRTAAASDRLIIETAPAGRYYAGAASMVVSAADAVFEGGLGMGSFATDQSLQSAELGILATAATGDKKSLREVIDRFKTPVLALALRAVRDLDSAFELAETAIGKLCKDLLAGLLPPTEWAATAAMYVTRRDDRSPTDPDALSPLEGLQSVPRVARRRQVREALPKLTLPELTAVLLQQLDRLPPARMVGLVASTESEVCDRLVSAQRKLLAAMQPAERPGEPEQAGTS